MNPHRNLPNPRESQAFGTTPTATRAGALAALLCLAPAVASASDHKSAPPAKSANTYPAFDTHPDEHVTIAADPCDDPKLCPFFRLPYIEHGLLPIRVVITNDSDRALSLEDARMQFISANNDKIPAATVSDRALSLDAARVQYISANNDKIPAATEDDINRRLFDFRSTQPIHVPLDPFPIKRTPVDKKVTQDDDDFGFKSSRVQPHSTLAGYLFYDIKDLDDPALKHAELYVKMIHALDGTDELFAFTIPFDKWLAANPDAPSNHPPHLIPFSVVIPFF